MKSNKFWIILFGVLIALSALAIFFMRAPEATHAQVFRNGVLIETIDLSALNETIDITLGKGSYNIIIIQAESGRIRISEADCFLGLCMRQGWRDTGIMPIICLPNRVTVRLIGGVQADVDGVVG